ncbi:MAG: dephospho-CoA kinase [Candidatus Melainabacteria bacterium GWA2_34_9]|nr:MAG: dephospho-CoA kinase [Candidatus Melainabacteria bacterium GWA2_34_9]
MIKLAITGNIASGKSLVEFLFHKEGITTIDTDKIVHNLLSHDIEIIEKVNNLFDINVKDEEGKIDRKKVGDIVFNDKNKLEQLEKILHPEVKKVVDNFFQEHEKEKFVAVAVPQLYEAGWEVYFDYVLLVIADDKIRIERLYERNHFTEEVAQKRLETQLAQNEKRKKADFVIYNSGDADNTRIQLKNILEKLTKMV